jgi:hypothetical protein
MRMRMTSIFVLGAVAMLATTVSAQDTTRARSTRRIPITKESGGEVVPTRSQTQTQPVMTRVDTVTVFRTDTVTNTITRVDTVTNTVTRVDTVTVTPPPPVLRFPSGLYFGVAGGAADVGGSLYNPNGMGYTAQAQLGWQSMNVPFGLRIDANYVQPGEDSQFAGAAGDPDIMNFNGDVKLALPILNHLFGMSPRFNLYGIGGATYTMYKNLRYRLEPGAPGGSGTLNISSPNADWENRWGWNAGGGASLLFGRTEIFAESRVISFKPVNAPNGRQFPIVLGINFY